MHFSVNFNGSDQIKIPLVNMIGYIKVNLFQEYESNGRTAAISQTCAESISAILATEIAAAEARHLQADLESYVDFLEVRYFVLGSLTIFSSFIYSFWSPDGADGCAWQGPQRGAGDSNLVRLVAAKV